MEPTNSIQIWLPEGKAAIATLQQKLIDAIINGQDNPIRIDLQLKALEEVVKTVRANLHVRHEVLTALSRYPEKTVELHGAQITKKLTPAQYDYSVCNDPTHNALIEQANDIKLEVKAREAFLKALKQPTTIVDDETGEVYTVNPPSMTQGETISIKFV